MESELERGHERRPMGSWIAALSLLAAALSTAPARAETITATLQFRDGNGTTKPIVDAKVEIWAFRPRGWGAWTWASERTVSTDGSGQLRSDFAFQTAGVIYGLRVFATNWAAQVFTLDLPTEPFFRKPGEPGGEIQRTANGPGDVLDFSYLFSDPFATDHFNPADALMRGYAYADARRDPRETDTIERANVLLSRGNTFFDPITRQLQINSESARSDFVVLHEYGHYLEERISSFKGVGTVHDGCTMVAGLTDMQNAGLAWMEGFADYFAIAVGLQYGSAINGARPASWSRIETPTCKGSSYSPMWTELFVAAALYDLIDGNALEKSDTSCTAWSAVDRTIFQIFDHELDFGIGNPTLQQFVDAWIGRGLGLTPLANTFANAGVPLRSFTPYDGTLLRDPSGVVWAVYGGARFAVPDSATLARLFPRGTTVQYGEVTALPRVPVDGTLLREESGAIWVIAGGAKFHVPDMATFEASFAGRPVFQLWDGALSAIPDVPADGARIDDSWAGYLFAGGAAFNSAGRGDLCTGWPITRLWRGALDQLLTRKPADGTMLRDSNGTVWVTYGGARFAVPDANTLVRLYFERPVRQLWNSAVNGLSVMPADGTLLGEESGAVWVIAGGARFHIPDWATLERLFAGRPIGELWDGALAGITTVPRDGARLREESSKQVYEFTGGAKIGVADGGQAATVLWDGALAAFPNVRAVQLPYSPLREIELDSGMRTRLR